MTKENFMLRQKFSIIIHQKLICDINLSLTITNLITYLKYYLFNYALKKQTRKKKIVKSI